MQMDKNLFKKIALIVAGGILLNWLVHNFSVITSWGNAIWGLFFPFILGLILAFLLNIPMAALEKKLFNGRGGKLRRPVSFIITLLLVLAVLALVMLLIIPELTKTISGLTFAMPSYISRFQKWAMEYSDYIPQLQQFAQNLRIDWNGLLDSISEMVRNGAFSAFNSAYGVAFSIISGTATFFIGFVFSAYLLLDKEHLLAQAKGFLQAYIPEKRYAKLSHVLHITNRTFSRFVTGQCTEAVVVILMFLLVLSVGGFQYALLISVLTGLLSFVPIFGAFISLFIGAALILASQGLWRMLAFILVYNITQQIDGNLVYPRIIGNSISLSPIWVLVAVFVGGGLMGLFGMLFFIPLFSVIYALMQQSTLNRLYAKGLAVPPKGTPPPDTPPKNGNFFSRLFTSSASTTDSDTTAPAEPEAPAAPKAAKGKNNK